MILFLRINAAYIPDRFHRGYRRLNLSEFDAVSLMLDLIILSAAEDQISGLIKLRQITRMIDFLIIVMMKRRLGKDRVRDLFVIIIS